MEEKKYELLKECYIDYAGHKVHPIIALKNFGGVSRGDRGGYVESEDNLSQEGNCWIDADSYVLGNARVSGDVRIHASCISGNAKIYGKADIYKSNISDNAKVVNTNLFDSRIYGDAKTSNASICYGNISGRASVTSSDDYCVIYNLFNEISVTFYKTGRSSIGVNYGKFSDSLEEFISMLADRYPTDQFQLYMGVIKAVVYKLCKGGKCHGFQAESYK